MGVHLHYVSERVLTCLPDPDGSNQDGVQPVVGSMFSASDSTMFGDGQHSTTPSSLMAELTSWGEFDSLVTAGIGGLDYMFLGDSTQSWEHNTENDIRGMLL